MAIRSSGSEEYQLSRVALEAQASKLTGSKASAKYTASATTKRRVLSNERLGDA